MITVQAASTINRIVTLSKTLHTVLAAWVLRGLNNPECIYSPHSDFVIILPINDQPAIDNQDPPVAILPIGDLTDSWAIMPNSTPARLESLQAIQISQMTPIACRCTLNLTPDDFYALFTKLPPYN